MIIVSTSSNGSVNVTSTNSSKIGTPLAEPIKYTTHFRGDIEFTNGWQLLWAFKYNQDEANKQLKALYKELVKALRPSLKADGVKATKKNIYSIYYSTDEFKKYSAKSHEINTKLGLDNKKFKEFEKILKDNGNW